MSIDIETIDWIARAKALTPLIAECATRIDREYGLPAELVRALHENGMYRLLLPRSCDGFEVDTKTFAETIETVAMADASTAWCLGQNNGCAMAAAYLPLEAGREIFARPGSVLAWGPPDAGVGARAVVADGGYRVTGTWQFASGSRQANWLGGLTQVVDRDGSPRLDGDGKPVTRTVLFPRADAAVTDVWQVVGLRGTGSDSYAIDDLFVPDAHTFTRKLATDAPGTLYRHSSVHIHAIAFAAVGLGIARRMLDDFVELARTKRPRRGNFGNVLRESNTIQNNIGLAEARLRAARAYLMGSVRDGWLEAEAMERGGLSLERRLDMRAASTFAINTAAEVADTAYRLAGATAIFDAQPFERRFRDMHAVTQQVQGHQANYETIGQSRLGLPFDLVI
ncbi:MAG TPA: acyl-CoA dehydrogenase family protein [Candidatus Lustribacter sp.]|nr:acyl-CoA dehydrogenase family protein [Candidatus Lustribacter sp.]